jgi:hypothetical protein
MGVHLGVCGFIPSHSPTLIGTWNVTPRLHSWPATLQALALVTCPKLGLRQWKDKFWKTKERERDFNKLERERNYDRFGKGWDFDTIETMKIFGILTN